MAPLAPLAVPVEIHAVGTGTRAFRLSRGISETLLRLERDLPFETGRPVSAELLLPDDARPIQFTGMVSLVPPDHAESEGEAARPRALAIQSMAPDDRRRVVAYVTERMLSP